MLSSSMGCALPSISTTSWPAGVSARSRNIQRCGMKLRVTPLSGLYSKIFIGGGDFRFKKQDTSQKKYSIQSKNRIKSKKLFRPGPGPKNPSQNKKQNVDFGCYPVW